MDSLQLYARAQDGFEAVLAAVRPDQWDRPSACAEWSVRDVAGHVIWGQHQIRAWATGGTDPDRSGAPGQPQPGVWVGEDPLATWRAARQESVATLTPESLARTTMMPGVGAVPVAGIVTLLTLDTATHTWDIGHALGMDVRLDPAVLPVSFEWARHNVQRRPGFFGPELPAPEGADEQTRMLAFLGRAAWQPVSA